MSIYVDLAPTAHSYYTSLATNVHPNAQGLSASPTAVPCGISNPGPPNGGTYRGGESASFGMDGNVSTAVDSASFANGLTYSFKNANCAIGHPWVGTNYSDGADMSSSPAGMALMKRALVNNLQLIVWCSAPDHGPFSNTINHNTGAVLFEAFMWQDAMFMHPPPDVRFIDAYGHDSVNDYCMIGHCAPYAWNGNVHNTTWNIAVPIGIVHDQSSHKQMGRVNKGWCLHPAVSNGAPGQYHTGNSNTDPHPDPPIFLNDPNTYTPEMNAAVIESHAHIQDIPQNAGYPNTNHPGYSSGTDIYVVPTENTPWSDVNYEDPSNFTFEGSQTGSEYYQTSFHMAGRHEDKGHYGNGRGINQGKMMFKTGTGGGTPSNPGGTGSSYDVFDPGWDSPNAIEHPSTLGRHPDNEPTSSIPWNYKRYLGSCPGYPVGLNGLPLTGAYSGLTSPTTWNNPNQGQYEMEVAWSRNDEGVLHPYGSQAAFAASVGYGGAVDTDSGNNYGMLMLSDIIDPEHHHPTKPFTIFLRSIGDIGQSGNTLKYHAHLWNIRLRVWFNFQPSDFGVPMTPSSSYQSSMVAGPQGNTPAMDEKRFGSSVGDDKIEILARYLQENVWVSKWNPYWTGMNTWGGKAQGIWSGHHFNPLKMISGTQFYAPKGQYLYHLGFTGYSLKALQLDGQFVTNTGLDLMSNNPLVDAVHSSAIAGYTGYTAMRPPWNATNWGPFGGPDNYGIGTNAQNIWPNPSNPPDTGTNPTTGALQLNPYFGSWFQQFGQVPGYTWDSGPTSNPMKPIAASQAKMSDWKGYTKQTVLCTELYKQGKLDEETYKNDKKTTKIWLSKRPLLKAGYLCFSYWPLWLLRNKKNFAEKYMHHVIISFSKYYADKQITDKKSRKKNYIGLSMMIFAFLFFPPLGLLTKISENKNYRLILSTLTTIIWFMPLFIYSIVIKLFKLIRS